MASEAKTGGHVLLDGLGHRFADGTEAIGHVDLEINRGEFLAILGPSGCGKSTLLRLVAGLLSGSSGTVTVDGEDPRTGHRQRDELAYVFQDPTLLPWRTVRRNVALPLELRGRAPAEIEAEVDRALDLVGLEEFSGFFPAQLSGGMRMRVSLARALVTRPGLLLLDEPFGALDEITRQRLNEELMRLWERDRWTGIFVTHNVYEAVYLSRRLLVMSSRPGRILAELEVPFPHPRDISVRGTAEFARIAAEATGYLSEGHR
jgi:NitT/TauT family transport system ATP-binding protein